MAQRAVVELLRRQLAELRQRLECSRALAGKRILLLPLAGGGIDLRTTNVNQLLELYGARRLAEGDAGR
jgi:hypothetical protein